MQFATRNNIEIAYNAAARNHNLEPNEVIMVNGCITQTSETKDIDPYWNRTSLCFGIDALIYLACNKIKVYFPLETVNDDEPMFNAHVDDNNCRFWTCPVMTVEHMEMSGQLRSDEAYVEANTAVYAFWIGGDNCPSYKIVRCEPPVNGTPHRKLYDLAIEYKLEFGYNMLPQPESKELMQAYNDLVPYIEYSAQ